MARFHAANNARTELTTGIDDQPTTTELSVDDAGVFPSTPFKISIGNEIMDVTEVNGNTLTVERGAEDTGIEPHNSGALVENRPTAGVWEDLWDDVELHKSEDTSHHYEEENEEISINFRNKFFYIDGNGDVFFRPDGDGNAGSSLGENGLINLWKVI